MAVSSASVESRRVLVLGAYGRLGPALSKHLVECGHEVLRQGRGDGAQIRCDPVDSGSVAALLKQYGVEAIVNLAAATSVDACEQRPRDAFAANVRVVESVATAVNGLPQACRPRLVHISTDQVYWGRGPHGEDEAQPPNVYALTKYAGELAAIAAAGCVLRTNFIGASGHPARPGLSDWIVGELRAGRGVTALTDVQFSPLHMTTLCQCIERVLWVPAHGVYNTGSHDGASKADLVYALADRLGLDRDLITLGCSSDLGLQAQRPGDMRLIVERFEKTFEYPLPGVEREFALTAEQYRDD